MAGQGKVLLFKGKGFISWLIRFQTRSSGGYSHAAILYPDGHTMLESWQGVGVRKKSISSWKNIDAYNVQGVTEDQWAKIFELGEGLVGRKYDYRAVLRFVTRRKVPDNDRWFCSELVSYLFQQANCPLLRGFPSEHSPRDISQSPLLQIEHSL